jgi:hypothetical protein
MIGSLGRLLACPHPEERAARLEGWATYKVLVSILRDAALRAAPLDEEVRVAGGRSFRAIRARALAGACSLRTTGCNRSLPRKFVVMHVRAPAHEIQEFQEIPEESPRMSASQAFRRFLRRTYFLKPRSCRRPALAMHVRAPAHETHEPHEESPGMPAGRASRRFLMRTFFLKARSCRRPVPAMHVRAPAREAREPREESTRVPAGRAYPAILARRFRQSSRGGVFSLLGALSIQTKPIACALS